MRLQEPGTPLRRRLTLAAFVLLLVVPAPVAIMVAGAVLAVPLDYAVHIHTFRFLQGALHPGAVVLDQQMAATLQAHIGDRVTLTVPGGGTHTYAVSGVALVTAPDKLFQPLNPQLGPAPAQPPANVAIMPLATFASTLARALPTIGATSRFWLTEASSTKAVPCGYERSTSRASSSASRVLPAPPAPASVRSRVRPSSASSSRSSWLRP